MRLQTVACGFMPVEVDGMQIYSFQMSHFLTDCLLALCVPPTWRRGSMLRSVTLLQLMHNKVKQHAVSNKHYASIHVELYARVHTHSERVFVNTTSALSAVVSDIVRLRQTYIRGKKTAIVRLQQTS